MKYIFDIFLVLYLLTAQNTSAYAEELETYVPTPPAYSADAVVIMDAETGLVLYGYEANTQMYPASITKIMTALLVLEHTSDLNERLEFSHRAVFSIPRNSSHIAMDEGETLTVYEALYGLMLSSANEVSLALAEHTAGSVEEFVELMNRRAVSLGANDTNFTNPSGLPGVGHVTTAYDMALIMRESVRNPTFVDIIGTTRFDIPPTERQPEVRELLNTNRLIRPGQFFNEYVVGGKTGWTNDAGNTLVTYAYNGDRRLIVTVLRGDGTGAFADTTALLEYGFALPLNSTTVFDAETYALTIPVYQEIGGNRTEIGRVNIRPEESLSFDLPPGFDSSWLRYELSVPETLEPPVMLGDNVGSIAVYVQNVRVGNVPLSALDAVFAYAPTSPNADEYRNSPAYYSLQNQYGYSYTARLSILDNEYILTLIIPLTISGVTLVIALIALLIRRQKRKARHALHTRYARYPEYYRYK